MSISHTRLVVIVSILNLVFIGGLFGQVDNESHHEHFNEISVATGIVPLPAEDELTIGFHFHYVRGIGKDKRFGIGLGFETIVDEHKHYTFSVVAQYRIIAGWIIGYAPGLMIREEGDETLYQLAHHIETAYEFELGNFHIGPMAEVGLELIGVHYMLGVHFGMDF